METRVLIWSAPKPNAVFPPTPMMLQIKFGCNRPIGLGDIHVWKCGRTDARTPARVPSYKLTLWAFGSGELKINGLEHVKVITAPYTDSDQPARPDHNHHMATQSSPLHTEKTVTWLRRCAGWAQSSMSTHLPRIPLSGSIDFKVTSLEIIYVTKSTYEIVKRAQYSHLALNIKLQWNNVREFCLKNNLQLILISITRVYAN